jgi:hypothetical protein
MRLILLLDWITIRLDGSMSAPIVCGKARYMAVKEIKKIKLPRVNLAYFSIVSRSLLVYSIRHLLPFKIWT